MGFLENRRGIPPSYAAARAALPAALAADLCLTGRLLEAEEAQRLGVVAEVHAPDDLMPRATELATEIASAPPSASLETKRRIVIERATTWRPLFEAEEQALVDALLGSSGAAAAGRRRTPPRARARPRRRPRQRAVPLPRSPCPALARTFLLLGLGRRVITGAAQDALAFLSTHAVLCARLRPAKTRSSPRPRPAPSCWARPPCDRRRLSSLASA